MSFSQLLFIKKLHALQGTQRLHLFHHHWAFFFFIISVMARNTCDIVIDLENDRNGNCNLCGKKFRSFKAMTDHQKNHQEARFKCAECGRKFRSQAELTVHSEDNCGQRWRITLFVLEHAVQQCSICLVVFRLYISMCFSFPVKCFCLSDVLLQVCYLPCLQAVECKPMRCSSNEMIS